MVLVNHNLLDAPAVDLKLRSISLRIFLKTIEKTNKFMSANKNKKMKRVRGRRNDKNVDLPNSASVP